MHLMRSSRLFLLALAAVSIGCGNDDNPVKATGPVTIKFQPLVYRFDPAAPPDTVKGEVTIDPNTATTQTVAFPTDSFVDVPRGEHRFQYRLDADYLPTTFTRTVDPQSTVEVLPILPAGSCRDWAIDREFCLTSDGTVRSIIGGWSGHPRLVCATNDAGEFCTDIADQSRLGATWPTDTAFNEYVSQAKLLVAAKVGPELPSAGHTMAMALFRPGDYSPRSLLHAVTSTDSSRFLNEVWTDARHMPLFLAVGQPPFPVLDADDRPDDRFGLGVKITYVVPREFPDAVFARYDITNISNTEEYRFRHPAEPASGHTITDIFLAPVIDADIGSTAAEVSDDNATVFVSDLLAVAYDGNFDVPGFAIPAAGTRPASNFYVENPGLVGLQLIEAPAGAEPRGLVLNRGGTDTDTLDFLTAAQETKSYQILSAGRAGVPAGCQDRGVALVCSPETPTDIRLGWSVGPIAALAPGHGTTITVAILLAKPAAGAFQSGAVLAPRNDLLSADATQSPLFSISENLRALAAQTKTFAVPAQP